MNLLFWGLTLGTLGKVLVVIAVLNMHHTLIKEHRVDHKVVLSYRQERVLTIIGLILIVAGFLCEVYFYNPTNMLFCHEEDCMAAGISAFLR